MEALVPATPVQAKTDGGYAALTDSPPTQGAPQVLHVAGGELQLVAPSVNEATPTLQEATRRLACFTKEVQQKRSSPLISSPPKQKVPAKRDPMPTRSSRIAAQPLAHIPTAKRGEALMKRMGVLPPTAPMSSGPKRAYEAIFAGKLTPEQVVALDELFPAANCKAASRTTRRATPVAA